MAPTTMLLLAGTFTMALVSVQALTSCSTPSGQSGHCVSKQSCEPVARMLRAGESSGPSYKTLYGSPACDTANLYEEKVCCPTSTSGSNTTPSTSGSNTTPRTSGSNTKQEGESDESDEDSGDGGDVSERRLGRRPRPHRRPSGSNPFNSDYPSRDQFANDFTTRRSVNRDPYRNPFEAEFGGNPDFSNRPSLIGDPFGVISDLFTTRRPFGGDPFGGSFGSNSDRTTRRPSGGSFGSDFDDTTRRPIGGSFGSNTDRTTRRPIGGSFGSDFYDTTRRPSGGSFGSNSDFGGSFGSNSDRTTRRPSGGSFGSDFDDTTRRPSGGSFGSNSDRDYTTRRPLRDRTTRRPSQTSSTGGRGGALISPEGCGPLNQDRIIGGNQTAVFELPWMVRLGYGSRRRVSYRCGGSLINHRYVLTAAHCLGGGETPTQVRLGENDAESTEDCSMIAGERVCAPPVVDIDVEDVIPHPEFSDDTDSPNYLKNDIALLRLRTPVTFTEAVRPICLPTGSSGNLEGKKAAVAGWGKDKNRATSGTRFLLKANVPVKSFSSCSRVYRLRGISLEDSSQMCAGGERGVDSCQGDSGGPLYRPNAGSGAGPRMEQVGVVSFGLENCAVEGVPGVYTRVENYMPWMTSTMRP